MSHTPLLLLAPRITDDSKSMWKAAVDLGWSVQRIPNWRVPNGLSSAHRSIAIYGEPLFAEAVADQLNLVLLEPDIDCLVKVPHEYLQRSIQIMRLGEARLISTSAFVKPADGKIFEPKVYHSGSDLPGDDQVDADIPVLRSGIVDFRLEVRCFVKNRQLVALSPYWRNDELAQDQEGIWAFLPDEEAVARQFLDQILMDERIALPPGCTVDIGRLADGSWAIIEANPCWGAGLYGCDPGKILQMITVAILPKDIITTAHLPWISERRRISL